MECLLRPIILSYDPANSQIISDWAKLPADGGILRGNRSALSSILSPQSQLSVVSVQERVITRCGVTRGSTLLKVEQTGDIISVIGHMHKSAIGIFEPNKCSSNIY